MYKSLLTFLVHSFLLLAYRYLSEAFICVKKDLVSRFAILKHIILSNLEFRIIVVA